MTPPTLVAPELEAEVEHPKDAEHLPLRDGNGSSQGTLPVSPDSELQNLNEGELKAAIKSAWKKHERLAKKDMGPLLYWLRLKLRAQGSRNDIQDEDRGFGAWVEDHLDISRRTADRWADGYALENGLKDPTPTSSHVTKSGEDDFYEEELRKHGKNIQLNCWVSQKVHKQYEQALKTIKKHFKIANDKEAVLKGVSYAAEAIATRLRDRNRSGRKSATRRRSGRLEAGHDTRRASLRKAALPTGAKLQ